MATVTLNWAAPTSGGPVSSYSVYRKPGSGLTPASVFSGTGIAANIPSGTTTYVDSSLASNAGAHSWVVTALNTGGESDPSNVTTETL